ncbi:hypothetical protein CAL26_26520 [Bordetella genomosp. 9]|uniref:Uncharacterized protein n=1 Tax=Bordetella genomosp. 9 TaxID=1416803 RepID=A0A261R8Q0_9BORD|nr:hypothetical protein CAL26_26520 [Bordetella genomosp. 9]
MVVGWGIPQGDQLGNPKYIVVYGYSGDNWFYADPSKNNVTKNAPLPIPKTGNVVTKVVYSRNPALRMR